MKKLPVLFLLLFSLSFYSQNDTVSVVGQKKNFVFTINGISGNGVIKMRKEQFKNAVIAFSFEDKKLTSKNVTSFKIKIPGIQAQLVKGNKIDNKTYQKILKTGAKGFIITLFDIKMDEDKLRISGPMCYLSPPLVIEIY